MEDHIHRFYALIRKKHLIGNIFTFARHEKLEIELAHLCFFTGLLEINTLFEAFLLNWLRHPLYLHGLK